MARSRSRASRAPARSVVLFPRSHCIAQVCDIPIFHARAVWLAFAPPASGKSARPGFPLSRHFSARPLASLPSRCGGWHELAFTIGGGSGGGGGGGGGKKSTLRGGVGDAVSPTLSTARNARAPCKSLSGGTPRFLFQNKSPRLPIRAFARYYANFSLYSILADF